MTRAPDWLGGVVSRISRLSRPARDARIKAGKSKSLREIRDSLPSSSVTMRDSFNVYAAMDATRYSVVSQNGERVDQMQIRFENALRFGRLMPDVAFIEQVIRPLVTWLKALSYLPDDGEFAKIAECAKALLKHIIVPESATRRTLQQFGSTEQLDRRDNPTEIARGFVEWTIPLLYRFVFILKAMATGERCTDTCAKLLASIERHDAPDSVCEIDDGPAEDSDATERITIVRPSVEWAKQAACLTEQAICQLDSTIVPRVPKQTSASEPDTTIDSGIVEGRSIESHGASPHAGAGGHIASERVTPSSGMAIHALEDTLRVRLAGDSIAYAAHAAREASRTIKAASQTARDASREARRALRYQQQQRDTRLSDVEEGIQEDHGAAGGTPLRRRDSAITLAMTPVSVSNRLATTRPPRPARSETPANERQRDTKPDRKRSSSVLEVRATVHPRAVTTREMGTQTDAPSFVARMKGDPEWRTNPVWWLPRVEDQTPAERALRIDRYSSYEELDHGESFLI